MNKNLFVIILFLVSFSFTSAHSNSHDLDEKYIYKEKITETKYFPDKHLTWSRTTYIDYDNAKRFPTYDYRHGYTYRVTTDYLEKYDLKKKTQKNYEKDSPKDSYNSKNYPPISYSKSYEKRECYHTAPKGKLFYIKCK